MSEQSAGAALDGVLSIARPVSHDLSSDDSFAILSAVQELSRLRDLAGVVDVVRRWARRLSRADGVTFILRDGEHCYYVDEDAIGPLWKGKRFPASSCVSGWAMVHRSSVVIADVFADPRVPHDAYAPTFVKSMAMVPVRREDPIAAIGAYWADLHEASAREIMLLQSLADATAVALANAELYLDVSRERNRFEQLTEALPQLVWTTTRDGESKYFNRQWSDFTGSSAEELLRGAGWSSVHPDDAPVLRARWDDARRLQTFFECECRLRRRDGEFRWMLFRAVPRILGGEILEWVGTSTEIQHQKNVEQEKADAVAVRDEFLAIASHELKTPLTSLQLQVQALLAAATRGRLDEQALPRLQSANRQIERLGGLIEQLLDVSRFTSDRVEVVTETVDMRDLVQTTVGRLEHDARNAETPIDVVLPIDAVMGEWDPVRIERVLENLISNALKYGARKPVSVRLEHTDSDVTIDVVDRGIGIGAADRERIFSRFERAVSSRHYGGLGLGLYIARQIVSAHGGTLAVESEPDHGARFRIVLPRGGFQR